MAKRIKAQEIVDKLTWSAPNIGKEAPKQTSKANKFCEGYKLFLNEAKTERECVTAIVYRLSKAGYRPYDKHAVYHPGDKVYYVNRKKSVIATTFGTEPVEAGLRLNGAHIDSPRLDLKPNPLYEKDDMALFKTHYYGGIRKYQWTAIPLAIHGVLVKKTGEIINIVIGEDEKDPVFCVTDLLPHLAAKQNERKLGDGIRGEELNVVVSTLPYQDDAVKEPVKLLALQMLYDKYGITEGDFYRAEIEVVPAFKAVDVGLDRSMVGAYGQDDRVCAYTALMAEIETEAPTYTTVTIFADKEEIGSDGNTGLNSDFVLHYVEDLAEQAGAGVRTVLRNSLCLSSDVNAAYDPTFADVYEAKNSSYLNRGCVLTKYTGARGKSGSNDASAETMAKVIAMMEAEGVYWQADELGAVDAGGGGTIAKFVSHMDVDTVDLGVPVLSMHSPFELTAKLDVFNTYKAFKAFYK